MIRCFRTWTALPIPFGMILVGILSGLAQAQDAGDTPATPAPLPVSPAAGGPPVDADEEGAELSFERVDPEELVAKAFEAPEGAVQLSKKGRLWVDKKGGQVFVDGYVAMTRGMLEMFACPAGTKEHESVVAVLARSRDVHTALLAVGAQSGTPVKYVPKFVPPTGQAIQIWVMWFDKEGKLHKKDAREWIFKTGTKKTMQENWVFAGSQFWKDPATGESHYEADSGDMICVSNFGSAMLDVPVLSSKENASLQYSAAEGNVPPEMTPVRLVMIPIPLPSDKPQPLPEGKADASVPPADKWLKKAVPAQ